MRKILRVFPRKTNASPMDENVRFGFPSLFDNADKIKISVAFTYDLKQAELLYNQWKHVAPTEIGGPATGMRGEEFTPGMYLKNGITITSRGCNNRCWFCSVWKREGTLRELEIKDGYNVMDDNLLACSESHIDKVFEMLKRQKERPMFTGGLEAKLITPTVASKLKAVNPKVMYFAYDTPDDLDPLINAGKQLREAGFKHPPKSHVLRCYCLCGYNGDTFEKAQGRFIQAYRAGFFPMAMLYRGKDGERKQEWITWHWQWVRPITVDVMCKKLCHA